MSRSSKPRTKVDSKLINMLWISQHFLSSPGQEGTIQQPTRTMARQGMWLPLERKTTEPTWILQQSRVVWYHLEAALPFRQLHRPRTTYFNIKLPVPFGSTRKCCNLWRQSKLEPEYNNQGNCRNYVNDKIFLTIGMVNIVRAQLNECTRDKAWLGRNWQRYQFTKQMGSILTYWFSC